MRFHNISEDLSCNKERDAAAAAAAAAAVTCCYFESVLARSRYLWLLLLGTSFASHSYAFAFTTFSRLSPLTTTSRGKRKLHDHTFTCTPFLSLSKKSSSNDERSSLISSEASKLDEPTADLDTQPQTTQPQEQPQTNGKNNNSDIRFASPLLDFGYPPAVEDYERGIDSEEEKPLLLYLPGFDGTYLSAFFQYPELHTICEVRCLVSTMDDRSTFDDLKAAAMEFLIEKSSQTTNTKTNRKTKTKTKTTASSKHISNHDVEKSTNNNDTTNNGNEDGNQNNNDNSPKDNNATDPSSNSSSWWPSPLRSLSNIFKGVTMTLPRTQKDKNNDTTSVTAKTKAKTNSLKHKTTNNDKSFQESKRPVYLAGESFGGILASEIALTILENPTTDINLKGLILINAATCYDRSRLAAEGPSVARLPKLLYVFGILRLLPMFLDNISLPQFLAIIQGKALPSVIDNPVREAYMGRLAFSLPILLQFMPQETFQWRLEQWLEVGCNRMAWRLKELTKYSEENSLRTLIIAGEKDLTLPSIAEAERLAQKLPNSHVHIVDGAGHANTCGSRLDMAAVMRNVFKELRPPNRMDEQQEGRIAMKQVAAEGKGIYFGMEPRYDGKRFGLSPTKYWSKEYYYRKRSPSEK